MKTLNILFKQNFWHVIPIGVILLGVSACDTTHTATRTSDGIYYDPAEEATQEVVYEERANQGEQYSEPIRIGGKYFDDQGNAPEQTYEEDPFYNDNRVVLDTTEEEDYIEWGEEGNTIINVNNYGSSMYAPYYPYPYYGSRLGFWGGYNFGFSFGWGGYYGYPLHHGFYGPAYPYYGFGYGYPYHWYSPHYNPYYPYYPNRYYPHGYLRNVDRGRGNSNQVSTASRNSSKVRVADGIRRSDKVIQRSRSTARNNTAVSSGVKRRDTDKVRVRRAPVRTNRSNSNVGTYSRPRTNTQGTSRPNVKTPKRRTDKVPVYKNSTPRTPRTNRGTYNSGTRRSSSFGGSTSTTTRSSRGGIRR